MLTRIACIACIMLIGGTTHVGAQAPALTPTGYILQARRAEVVTGLPLVVALTAWTCNQPPVPPSPTTLLNPNTAILDDPLTANRSCRYNIAAWLNTLPRGGYVVYAVSYLVQVGEAIVIPTTDWVAATPDFILDDATAIGPPPAFTNGRLLTP